MNVGLFLIITIRSSMSIRRKILNKDDIGFFLSGKFLSTQSTEWYICYPYIYNLLCTVQSAVYIIYTTYIETTIINKTNFLM